MRRLLPSAARGAQRGCRRAQPIGLGPHPSVLGGRLMVPSEQVQQAVGEQHGDLRHELSTVLNRLLSGGGNTHDDVAQERASKLGEFALAHRKSKHVCRAIFPAIGFVQVLNLIIAG